MRSISPLLCNLTLILLITGCSGMTATQQSGSENRVSTGSAKNPKLSQALQSAHQLFEKKKVKQAKTELQELIKQNPNQAAPHINLGIIQLSENDPEAAEKSFKAALEIDKQNPPAHNQLGVALRMQGRFSEAEQAYQAALKHEPAYDLAHRNLGILYDLYLAKPELALEHYQRYQTLAGTKDKEIENWIIDLQRRIGK
ncbi:MAG: tetratricopeptide repeat protein [Candidatus Thiodiazotropha sp. L084R]